MVQDSCIDVTSFSNIAYCSNLRLISNMLSEHRHPVYTFRHPYPRFRSKRKRFKKNEIQKSKYFKYLNLNLKSTAHFEVQFAIDYLKLLFGQFFASFDCKQTTFGNLPTIELYDAPTSHIVRKQDRLKPVLWIDHDKGRLVPKTKSRGPINVTTLFPFIESLSSRTL